MAVPWKKCGRMAKGLCVVAVLVGLAVMGFGIRAWLTRTRPVPEEMLSKVRGSVSGVYPSQGEVYIDLYNGSSWSIDVVTFEFKTPSGATRRYRDEVRMAPLANYLELIRSDEVFLSQWSRGADGDRSSFIEAELGPWRIVSATGRPGGG